MKLYEPKAKARLSVLSPYDFGLYPKLFIHGPELFLPFRYSPTRWSRIITLENGSTVPVDVTFNGNSDEPELQVTAHKYLSTDECREIKRKLAECFCAHLDIRPLYESTFADSHARALVQRLH